MDIHDNARTTRHSRMLMMQRLASGWTVAAVAAAQVVSGKTCASGATATRQRRGRPGRSVLTPAPQPTPLVATTEVEIVALRHQRLSSPAIAQRMGRPVSSIGVVLRRQRLGRLPALKP
jgi:hypothetical protein